MAGPHGWTFLTNHGHVLVAIAQNPDIRIREIADAVGITERAAQKIVNDLVGEGYVQATRTGRRNTYKVDPDLPFRHPMVREHHIGELLRALAPSGT